VTRTASGDVVELPQGHTSSSYLHELVLSAQRAFPRTFHDLELPREPGLFKQRYASLLVEFEAARVVSEQRAEVARFMCREAARGLTVRGPQRELPLDVHLAREAEPLAMTRVAGRAKSELSPAVSFAGTLYEGPKLAELAGKLEAQFFVTPAAARALTWLSARSAEAGSLSLRGQRFVLLGAGAELAPTELLLQAGAEVLWLDVREPSRELLESEHGGALSFVRGGADLLTSPERILATMRAFSAGEPVHVWMYAYAGGGSQEWRLTATMNALVRALPRELVRSVAMLISPTSPALISPSDAAQADARRAAASAFQRTLARAGRLRDSQLERDGTRVARSIVPLQGTSYQAAQYLGKALTAEAFAVYGTELSDAPSPLTVSANVAPITATRSLAHPMFEAAFLGAPRFDIWISKPLTTRALNGLISLHDVLNPEAPGAATHAYATPSERARALFTQQVHGGVYALPFALAGCIMLAAISGLSQKPKLALGLLR
jgi:hypothetical protein